MNEITIIDAMGLLCPLPVLKLRKRLMALAPGDLAQLRCSDPASWVDVPHFCAGAGHVLLEARQEGEMRLYLVRRGAADPAP